MKLIFALVLGFLLVGCIQVAHEEPVVSPDPSEYVQCAERTQACTREYMPVCAQVDNGIRCITTPCDSTDYKTYANKCTACADEKVYGYTPGECKAKQYMLCNKDGLDREDFANQFDYECVEQCPQGMDEYGAQIGWLCINHISEQEILSWPVCEKQTDCGDLTCGLATQDTRGQPIEEEFRCISNDYSNYMINQGLTLKDEDGGQAIVIS